MQPILYTANIADDDSTNAIIIDNCTGTTSFALTAISPSSKLPKLNLKLWSLHCGFELFKGADALVISDKIVTRRQLTALRYVRAREKMNSVGLISINEEHGGDILYEKTGDVSFCSFMMLKSMFLMLKNDLNDGLIFR